MPHIHLIGIGGAGLSAIATVLLQQGYTVSGSDMQESDSTARLRALGASVAIGHRAETLGTPDTVVYSSAIPANNPELEAARARNIPTYKRPVFLGQMMRGKRGIAVAGTHGKTTTTALTAYILEQASLSPTYIIGGFTPQLNSNAAAGQSDLFVIEADEYDHTFLSLKPEIAVITNIEWDHPDIYPTEDSLFEAFDAFIKLVPAAGKIIACGDDFGVKRTLPHTPQVITYGFEPSNTWQALNLQLNPGGGYRFDIEYQGRLINNKPASLRLPGLHNVQNGLAALIAATSVGVSMENAIAGLAKFSGVGRRFEIKGEINGVTVIDDYAHHPSEIRATLAAARSRYPKQSIWAIFQPHTFSRTKLLLDEFAAAFDDADRVIILDIFPSREEDDGSISSADIISRMKHPDAQHIGGINDAAAYLKQHLSPGNVMLTLGAGDGYKVGETILRQGDKDAKRFLLQMGK